MIANLLSRAMPFLNKALPMGIASQGLSKIDPRIKNFIQSSLAAGYTMDTVLDFVRDKFQGEKSKQIKSSLQQRESSRQARPDEKAALSRIRQSSEPGDILQAGAGLVSGLGAGYFGADEGQDQQMQSVYPSEISEEQDQQRMIGQRPQMQQLEGPEPESQPSPPEGPISMPSKGQKPMVGNILNLLDSYDPVLADVVRSQMSQGADPVELTKFLKHPKKFKNPIDMIEKDTAQSFEKLLSNLMDFKKPKTREEALGAFRQNMMNRQAMESKSRQSAQATQQPQGQGQGTQKLLAILQQLKQARGG
jgi:hypothetical protein